MQITENNLTLVDHLVYLRSPMIIQNSKYLIILLNSLSKKLLNNEGVVRGDDIHRGNNSYALEKVRKVLGEQQEVQIALKILRT